MGFFSRLFEGMKKTKKSFGEKLKYIFTGNDLDEDFFEELEYVLISSDFGVERKNQKDRRLQKTSKRDIG